MDAKNYLEKTTPSKNILNSVHGKFTQHNGLSIESPFRLLPNTSTPPSRLFKIKNPFEPHLQDKLHMNFFSPSVFQAPSSKSEHKFKWTIDELSSLKPAHIDETTIEQHELTDHDSIVESTAQAHIDYYFRGEVAPSPFHQQETAPTVLLGDCMSPAMTEKTYHDGVAQTMLTLPPKLPADVEAILKPYMFYNCDRENINEDSSLFRKLFPAEFTEESDSESIETTSIPPCSLSPPPKWPPLSDDCRADLDTDRKSPITLVDCYLSPVKQVAVSSQIIKSSTKLNFSVSGEMDTSTNVVPDINERSLPRNDSMNFDVMSNSPPPREVLSDSIVYWDMEYKNVVLLTPEKTHMMDVSNSNTPKSKIFSSQRKNLCESFSMYKEFEGCCRNEIGRNQMENGNPRKKLNSNMTVMDSGYQTVSGSNMSIDGYHSLCNISTSTPTKK